MNEQAFYLQHGVIGHPGASAHYFENLPSDIPGLCKLVQGIYQHYMAAKDMPQERRIEVDIRYMPDILEQIHRLDPRPLIEARPRERRFIGCCRDAALLLVTMARHLGIPARSRVGFATYIRTSAPDFKVDHVVGEIWDADLQRWRLVDPEQPDWLIEHNNITFDVTDIPRDRFIVGGQAWDACRRGEDDPLNYGVTPDDPYVRGWWFVRNRLIHDLATQNRMELLLWDSWGIMEYDYKPTDADLALMDQVAKVTQHGTLTEKQALYQRPEFTAPRTVMSYSPVQEWSQVELRI
jgi:hypothetical protein